MAEDFQLVPYLPPDSALRSGASTGVRVPANYSGKRVTSAFDALKGSSVGAALDLINQGVEAFQPIWKKFDHTSSLSRSGSGRSFSNMVEFDVDFHQRGLESVSFNVKFSVLITPRPKSISPSSIELSGPSIRVKENMQWADLRAIHSTGNFGSSLIDIMRGLLLESAHQVNVAALPAPVKVDPRVAESAKADLLEILESLQGDDPIGQDEAEMRLKNHYKAYCFPDTIRDLIQANRADNDFISMAFKALANEGAKRNNPIVREFLLEVSASHSKASVRYAAVEALSLHLDERVRNFFTIRLKDERNKTIASSISAAIS